MGTDPGFLQKATTDTGGFGCNHGSDNRQERPIQDDQRVTKKDQSERKRWQRWTGEAGSTPPDTYGAGFQEKGPQQQTAGFERHGELDGFTANSNGAGIQGRQAPVHIKESEPLPYKQPWRYGQPSDWESFPTQSPVCHGDDGFPIGLDGITFSKWRIESIKAGGNAIVPQVALQIFRVINEMMLNINA
ncbi:hypothetical protein [Mucilaginibacter sp.]|uniref:hypothetical protein n=1 Tax=Mucilaginibacter sp. TaxID=1882438 RepID=UPI00345BA14E